MKFITAALIALILLPAAGAAAGQTGGCPWGSPLETPYRSWAWISEFTEEDQNTWAELSGAQQSSLLKKAGNACLQADKTAGVTEAKSLAAISDETLRALAVCTGDGETRALALQKKRDNLKTVMARAKTGPLSPADLAWLKGNSIDFEGGEAAGAALKEQQQKQEKNNKKSLAKLNTKLSPLKGAGSADKISAFYDGGKTGKGAAGADSSVRLKAGAGSKIPEPQARGPKKALTYTPPPEIQLSQEFKGMEGYKDIRKKDPFTAVMNEVDKDGASGGKANAAKAATLKAVYQVSKDFNETFINNPSPNDTDVRLVIDKIKNKAKNPNDAWEIALQMRKQKDFPALRDAEHYLWSCTRTNESKWNGAATMVSTPLYSLAKMPGLRKLFFDDDTSPPSISEVKWGAKGVTECWKK